MWPLDEKGDDGDEHHERQNANGCPTAQSRDQIRLRDLEGNITQEDA
jgi:hypothetical protein